jgi:hypothetical protein
MVKLNGIITIITAIIMVTKRSTLNAGNPFIPRNNKLIPPFQSAHRYALPKLRAYYQLNFEIGNL